MIYTLDELKSLILPILQSMPIKGRVEQKGNEWTFIVEGDAGPAADAIIEIIKQDREARDGSAGQNTNS